jgi:hypothetical protein
MVRSKVTGITMKGLRILLRVVEEGRRCCRCLSTMVVEPISMSGHRCVCSVWCVACVCACVPARVRVCRCGVVLRM